jgi:serine/threonine protein kinase
MEWCPGGDLATMIENTGGIQEAVVRRYTAELVVIIGSLHRLGIVHRDIKPDNVLIDATGHLKLTDFGLSSLGHDGRPDGSAEPASGTSSTTLIVGTPKYLAPEAVMNQSPSYDVDWWALGVTIFISLTARAPFRHRTENGMFRRILAGQYAWPSSMPVVVSPECKDVVAAFLTVDRRLRLGARGEPEVRAHPWFTGIDFDTLHDAPPPSVPSLDNSLDTGNFPTLPGEKNVAPSGLVEDDARTPAKDHSFDFSFFDVPVDIPEEDEDEYDDDDEEEVERDPRVEEELRRVAKKSQEGEWLSANLRVPPKRGDGLSPLEFGMSGFPGHGFDESTDEEFASFSMSSNPSSGMRSPTGLSLLSRSATPKLSTSAPSKAGSWRRQGTKMVSVLYIQMEYVPSLTLRGYLDERPPLDAFGPTGGPHPMVTDAVAILGQITKGLAFLHSRYVIHRDLKPQNIFVRREADGSHTALIGDFGLAVSSEASGGPPGSFMMNTSDDESSEQSIRGGVTTDDILGVGTLLYASPEQLQRSSRHLMVLSSSTDIFSLGIITVELFCNSIYHTAPLRHRRRLNNARVGQLPTDEPVLSARPELRALIRGMVNPVPEDRPRADEVLRHPVLGSIRRSSSSMLSGDDDESSGSESHRVRRRPLRRRKSSRASQTSGGRAAAAAARSALRASTGGMTISCGRNEEGGCIGCAHCTGQSHGTDRATSESRRSRHERTMSKSASPTGKSSGLAQVTALP